MSINIKAHQSLNNKIGFYLTEKKRVVQQVEEEAGEEYSLRVIKKKIEDALKNLNISFWLEKEGVRTPISLQIVLGSGGQKYAWKLSDQNVLMLPNYDADHAPKIAGSWGASVQEEVRVSQFLNQHDLLNCNHQFVKVFLDPQSEDYLPAFVSDSFDELKRKNIFVVEGKSNKTSPWLKEKNRVLFQNEANLLNEESWDEVLKPFVSDMTKIIKYGIPAYGDSFNFAIQKRDDTNFPYQVRYFGLDFSKKSEHHFLPLNERGDFSPKIVHKKASNLLSEYLERIMEIEYSRHPGHKDYSQLKKSLVDKYAQAIAQNFKN